MPEGASLYNVMSGPGPSSMTFKEASYGDLPPVKVRAGSIAFIFESSLILGVTDWALKTCEKVQEGYSEEIWVPLKVHFHR